MGGQLRDVEVQFEDEARQSAELAEKSGLANRRGAALLAEVEESNALLDSASRGKKQADAELVAARGSVNDMTAINGKAAADMLKLMMLLPKPRDQKRRLREPWLMLLALLMNSELSKIILVPLKRARQLLLLPWLSLN